MAGGPPPLRQGLPEAEVSANRMTRANCGSHGSVYEDGCRCNKAEGKLFTVTDGIQILLSTYVVNKCFSMGFQD
jgi:hypothetical protein